MENGDGIICSRFTFRVIKTTGTRIIEQSFLLSNTDMGECACLLRRERVYFWGYKERLIEEPHLVWITRCLRRDDMGDFGDL